MGVLNGRKLFSLHQNMSVLYLVFKRDGLFNLPPHPLIPSFLTQTTLVHTKIMFRVACPSFGCLYCSESQRDTRTGSDHFLAYYATLTRNWMCEVDCKRFVLEPHAWAFLEVPVADARGAHDLVRAQLGKPINMKGYFANYIFSTRYGVSELHSNLNIRAQPSWLCCELALAILADQGYRSLFSHLVPCQVFPVELWAEARCIPGCKALLSTPTTQITPFSVDAYTLDWP
jgi:hypothetical protein